jgi:hypothetical protein
MMTILLSLILFALAMVLPSPCIAVNFYDGVRAPKGHYVLTYSSYYTADKLTNADGNVSNNDYNYRKNEEIIRYCYYSPNLVLTALIPSGHVHSGAYGMSSKGIGDLNLGIGHFLPIKQADVLPALFVKLRNGEYTSGKAVNYGTNQYENPATKVDHGNELYLQFLPGIQITKILKAGPSFNWMKSDSQKNNGAKVNDSKRESISIGGDVYLRLPVAGVTFTYLNDIQTKNTTKGHFFQIKTTCKF